MQREEVKEFHGMHCHFLVHGFMLVVLPVVCYHAIGGVFLYAGVADCYTISIATNILKHLIHTLGRRTAVNHPSLVHALLADILRNNLFILLEM